MYHKKEILTDQEKILLSRLYKLDRQLEAFIIHHKDMSMNKLIPKTDFIKKAYALYQEMNSKLIMISQKQTKHIHRLVDLNAILNNKKNIAP